MTEVSGACPGLGASSPMSPAGSSRAATVVIHLGAESVVDGVGVAEVSGWGPVLADRLADLLAGCQVTVRPVIDLNQVLPVDAYEVPDRMRAAVEQRNPVCVFPFGQLDAARCDLDHTVPYVKGGPAGQTAPANLGPLTRRAHRLKTHGHWQLRQTSPGVFEWRSPAGFEYVVTAAGTLQTWRPTWFDIDELDPIELWAHVA